MPSVVKYIRVLVRGLFVLGIAACVSTAAAQSASGPLRILPSNPRYFCDANGKAVFLTGSHAWLNFQDGGTTYPPLVFDFEHYLNVLTANNHNFIRLWTWEQSKWIQEYHGDYYFDPLPFARTGTDTALDGKPKFDLTKFNQAYFDRLRSRVVAAGNRGIYVSVMLFDGWSISNYALPATADNTPFNGHPFNKNNNINGINGDPNGDAWGIETHTLSVPAVTAIQEAYVKKVLETVNDLDNVLFEISNESNEASTAWQYHMIAFVKQCEAAMPKQHPVGMTAQWPTQATNPNLFASAADWVSPNNVDYFDTIPAADGSKVIILDTDHIFGIGGTPQWFWKAMTRGMNPIYMDTFDNTYPADYGGPPPDSIMNVIRTSMGVMRHYAQTMNFNLMLPHNALSSTSCCLANPSAADGQYLVFSQWGGSISVDLSASKGPMVCEWYFPASDTRLAAGTVQGGVSRTFASPASVYAVLSIVAESTLPVELSSFSAARTGARVCLTWSTATEVNNYGFDIERRTSSERAWQVAGSVKGMGTTNVPHAYVYYDDVSADSVSYRLKQIDRDGTYAYSAERTLFLVSAPDRCELSQNFPNPFNPTTSIRYRVDSYGPVTLTVTDVLGRTIAELVNETKAPGSYVARWDARSAPSGMYFYTLRSGSFKATFRMLLQK